MRLSTLVDIVGERRILGHDVDVEGLAYDSREVKPGDLFVAIKGFVHDGHDFAADAVRRGAVAVMVEREVDVPREVPIVMVPSTRRALGLVAASFYGHPSKELGVIGVTGTNGKTTTTHLVKAVLEGAGHKVGLIGTVHVLIGNEVLPVERTTPEALDLQRFLRSMVDAGCEYAVLEVSSHALELHRVTGCEFDVGILTNITQDHLDFHGTFERYREAKERLFTGLGRTYYGARKAMPSGAVLNWDDPSGRVIARGVRVPVLGFGTSSEASLRAEDISVSADGSQFTAVLPGGERERISLRLTGRFNVYNALAALGAGLILGVPAGVCARALEGATQVQGRFQLVDGGQEFAVIVDYAHTPDGLENILNTAKEFARGRIICVFGCGGDRDRSKRPIMGRIAATLADEVIVTSDNPRSEDPAGIAEEIVEGIRGLGSGAAPHTVILDRRAAINHAIEMAERDDVVIIAGKGHETYQIFRDRVVPFDDREVAREAVQRRTGLI